MIWTASPKVFEKRVASGRAALKSTKRLCLWVDKHSLAYPLRGPPKMQRSPAVA